MNGFKIVQWYGIKKKLPVISVVTNLLSQCDAR